MSKIQAVVFDVYKTLLDNETDEENPRTYQFLSRWLSYHGIDLSPERLRLRYLELCQEEMDRSLARYPEIDIGRVFGAILGALGEPGAEMPARVQEFALLFRILTTTSISVRPGVRDLLERLRGTVGLGIVSNAQRLFTIPELTRFALPGFFDHLVLSSDLGVRKPAPEIFACIVEALALPPEAILFVGDNLFDDIQGAGSVGMKTAWIDRGAPAGDESQVANPDFVLAGGDISRVWAIVSALSR